MTHPYAGNPASFPVSITLIDDADAPNASNFDLAPQGLADRTAWLRAQSGATFAENWLPVTSVTGIAWGPALWDPISTQWLVATEQTGSPYNLHLMLGSGIDPIGTGSWANVDSGPLVLSATRKQTSIAIDSDGSHFYVATIDSASNSFGTVVVAGGGPYQQIESGGGGTATDNQLIVFGGYLVAAIGSSAANTCRLRAYATPVPPTTTMADILVSAIAGAPATPTVTAWISKSNGSYVLECPTNAQATPFMLKSTPASNLTLVGSWTAETALSSVVNGTDTIVGLDWGIDGVGPCWLALVHRAATTRVIRSSDGINWTLVQTLSGAIAANNLLSLCFAGGLFIAIIALATGYGATFSLDGGLTWWLTQLLLPAPNLLPGIAGSPTQAVAWNTTAIRFSQCSALPATPLT